MAEPETYSTNELLILLGRHVRAIRASVAFLAFVAVVHLLLLLLALAGVITIEADATTG